MKKQKAKDSYQKEVDKKRMKFIIKAIRREFPNGSKVLDVGCGNGILSNAMANYGFNVTGIDVSEKAIGVAISNKVRENVTFKVVSAENIAKLNEEFDVVVCSEVLEHLYNPGELIKTIGKLIHDNGMVIVTVPNGVGPRELFVTRPLIYLRDRLPGLYNVVNWIKRVLKYQGTTIQSAAENLEHVQFFKFDDLRRLFESNGFQITQTGKSNFIDDIFPISLLSRYFTFIQKIDSRLANILPLRLAGGFFTVLKKN